MKQMVQVADMKKKTSVPWNNDEPTHQNYHVFSSGEPFLGRWNGLAATATTTPSQPETSPISRLALYSWNIDFMLPFPDSRMRAAIRHLQESHISKLDANTASIVYLQECVESDLQLLAADPWIRSTFALTDVDNSNWQSGLYGTVTLVDLRLPISSCFRVHYSQTKMERDVLVVDVSFGKERKAVRFCNSHLESLAMEPPLRPAQVQMMAQYMHDNSVHGAAAAGDFNAIQDFDRHLHTENNLKDAYLELGGEEDDAKAGHTWGQQAATSQRNKFGTTRMDKVYFCGGLRLIDFSRFGAGVEVEDKDEKRHILQLGFDRAWITDHLGVMAVFELAVDGSRRDGHL